VAAYRTVPHFYGLRDLHFDSPWNPSVPSGAMKSRLLPPPAIIERELRDSPAQAPARRVEDSPTPEIKTLPAAEPTPTAAPVRSAPQVSARPQGRFLVAAILVICVITIGSLLWSTFFRDAAYGVVAGKVTAISPPWSGTLSAVYVQPSDLVRQGDVLAIVDDPELQAQIDQLGDDLRETQASLDAQAALLAIAARERGDAAAETRAEYYDLRGELLAEQSRYDELTSKLSRRQELADRRAVSNEEIESLQFVKQGLAAKIENIQLAVAALEARTEAKPASGSDAAQLKPWLAKIESHQAEIRRLRAKQRRGTIRAPSHGTIIAVPSHVGERATPEQPLLEFLPEGQLELVLYVPQDQANIYRVGQQLAVAVEPIAETLVCQITHIGQRFEKPQSHVPGRYHPEEKLLPIYLAPPTDLPADANLRIGSTVRLPTTLFGNSN